MAIEKLSEFAKDGQKNTDDLTLTDGFPVSKKPARQWFNWLFNTLTLKINEIIEADYIRRNEIVDNLTTNDATKPLSAKQGEVLDEKITNIPVYSLPTASTTAKGGVKVGTGLSIANEVLSVSLDNTLTSTSDTQALTAAQGKNLNDKMFGVDQGWKNITASTILNTEYTNTNPKTIFVTGVLNGDDQSVTLTVRNKNGDVFEIKCGTSPSSPGDVFHNVSAPIAPGESYKFSRSAGTLTIWMFS